MDIALLGPPALGMGSAKEGPLESMLLQEMDIRMNPYVSMMSSGLRGIHSSDMRFQPHPDSPAGGISYHVSLSSEY